VVVSSASSGSSFGLAERWFLRDWSVCLMDTVTDLGEYLRTSLEFNPGNPVTCFMSSAVHNVDKEGENNTACANETSLAGEAERWAALTEATVVGGMC
jgi:hypothetical protein